MQATGMHTDKRHVQYKCQKQSLMCSILGLYT